MKKLIMFSLAAFVLLVLAPVQSNATSDNDPKDDALTESSEVTLMIDRLEEIQAMDVSVLARSERRELRREVREIKKELKANSAAGGLYISVGAAILIVLLLILLL